MNFGASLISANTTKYFDANRYVSRDSARAFHLGLHQGPTRCVLDIGYGFGYFLLACKLLGHTGLGLDLPKPVLDEVTKLLDVRKLHYRIEAYQPLPSLPGEPFDLVTAFGMTFNNHTRANLWDVAEWQFFLDDLSRHLRPGAKIVLMFNKEPTGRFLSDSLQRFFRNGNGFVPRTIKASYIVLEVPTCLGGSADLN